MGMRVNTTDERLLLGCASLGELRQISHDAHEPTVSPFRLADFRWCSTSSKRLQCLRISTTTSENNSLRPNITFQLDMDKVRNPCFLLECFWRLVFRAMHFAQLVTYLEIRFTVF
jgi:hypothetical protein